MSGLPGIGPSPVSTGLARDEERAAFEAMADAFERAAQAAPGALNEFWCTLSGRRARVRMVGAALAGETSRPLVHLEAPADSRPPQLTIDLWDGRETGVPPPVEECRAGLSPQALWDGTLAASPDGRYVRHEAGASVTWLDRRLGRIIGFRLDGRYLSAAERSRPVLVPLLVCGADWNVPVIHAGLVASDGQGVLLGGPGGSGKTTVALACLLEGLDYLADDHVGLGSREAGGLVGHSLYSTARVDAGHLARLPALAPLATTSAAPGEKHVLSLGGFRHDRLQRWATIRALVLPRIGGAGTPRLRPASKGEALRGLAPSSLHILPESRRRGFDRLVELIEHVPAYALDLGPDLRHVPASIRHALAEASSS